MANISVKLLSFNDYDDAGSGEEFIPCKERKYVIQMFGTTLEGESVSITATDFTPYFYVLVADDWKTSHKQNLIEELYKGVGSKYFENSIINSTLIKRKKLYGFNAGKQFKFVRLDFSNQQAMRKFRNLWYYYEKNGKESVRKLKKLECCGCDTELYEAQIPPLLRMFHTKNIKPSGWILLPLKYCKVNVGKDKGTTSCHREFIIDYKRIISDPDNEKAVPYSIASFDIEASSSHGDFPLAKKNYKKLAQDMVDVWEVVAPDSGQLGSPGSRLASMTTSSSVIDSDELAVAAFFVGRANKAATNIAVSGGGYTQQSIRQDSDGFPGGYVGTRTASPSGTVTAAWTFDQYDAATPAFSDVFTAVVTVRAVTSGGGGTITLSGGGEIQLDHILSPSGYTASGSVGSLFNASNASVEITGNGGATALGTVNTAVVYAVSGFSATSALGTVVSPGANDVTHAVDGFQGTLSLGGLDQSIGSEISLLGFGLTGSIGEVISGDAGPSGVTNGNDNGLNVVRVSVTGWVDIVYRADPSVADPTEPGYQFSNGRSFNSPT